jgi:HK97 family phage major capsid protein
LTVPEVAEWLGVNRTTVYRLIHENELPAVRLRGGPKRAPLRIPEDELEAWLFANPEEPRDAQACAAARVKDDAPALPRGASFRLWRPTRAGSTTDEEHAFWEWAMAPPGVADNASDWLPEHEYRVLSKAASGGGFLVPTDVSEAITAAARAASAVAQVALELTTAKGETLGMSLTGTHGTAFWVAESGSYTATDETITQQNLSAFKGGTKIIVSEELREDEDVALDD